MTGTVKEYDQNRGFGFITGDNGDDYFVHVSGLGPKLQKFGLRAGQKVAFDTDYDHKGDKAINVRPG
jgi:CspA family cold shock protein